MEIIRIIIALTLLSSCYTKKHAIEKFCSPDTLMVTIHDTIKTETIHTDTVFSVDLDSVYITKDKLRIVYKRIHDSVYISGECVGDTIYINKEIKVPVMQPKSVNWLFYLIAGVLIGLISRYFIKKYLFS